MAEIIKMPLLSDTMEEGVIAAWHKKVGDSVSTGDLLAEIETDKATMDFESPADGVLLHIGVEEGDATAVGSLLAIIGDKGEDVSSLISSASAPAAKAEPQQETAVVEQPEVPVAQVVSAPANGSGSQTTAPERIKASPLAKAMAKAEGIDIALVPGTGEHGRIVKRDIENFKQAPASPVREAAPAMVATGTDSYRDEKVSQMRKTIARRLSESKFTAPHFYLTMEIDMDKAVESRKALNEVSPTKISYNDMIIKAAAATLRQHPDVNASWMGDTLRYYNHVHIGVAVAVDEGLLVPVIRNADMKGMAAIAAEVRELAGKARDKKLQPHEWEGNTFTISNLGMFGIEEFTAIINPPEACIMAVGAITQKAVVKDGEIVVGHRMKVTMSCDHRVVDGAVGAAFLQTFKQLLEDPLRILI